MKRPLLGLLIIVIGTISVLRLTSAFFSDTETSTGNILQAGELDLKIDNTCYYNGLACRPVLGPDDRPLGYSTWSSSTGRGGDPNGERCSCTWEPKDLEAGDYFFDFTDLKPGDREEDTISFEVQNPAWACMKINITQNTDESCTEPEILNDLNCPDTGDLAQNLNFVFWSDDGDNIHQTDEFIIKEGTASAILVGDTWTLADSGSSVWPTPGPIPANETRYIGKYWCFGTLSVSVNPPGFSCDGSALNNAAQTDKVLADVEFTAVQSRHNPGFLCNGNGITPTPPIITPTITPTPTPLACNQADVMLVLDRSGSISSTELSQLKTAAKDFVDSLGLTALGIHAGMSSFATSGSLNQHLSSDPTTVKNSIDTLISSGFTNLKSGIDLAKGELDNPGDGHDRAEPASPDKMIVITDGHPNRPFPESTADDVAATSADTARAAGSEIFVVGVGSDVDATYLQNEIADDSSHYYPVSGYGGLQTVLQNLDLCD